MASMRECVVMPGLLRAQGYAANCRVTATKVSLAGTNYFSYVVHVIDDVTEAAPDGEFQLFVPGQIIPVRCKNGRCVSI